MTVQKNHFDMAAGFVGGAAGFMVGTLSIGITIQKLSQICDYFTGERGADRIHSWKIILVATPLAAALSLAAVRVTSLSLLDRVSMALPSETALSYVITHIASSLFNKIPAATSSAFYWSGSVSPIILGLIGSCVTFRDINN